MATTPPKKKKKGLGGKRVWIAIGVVVLAVLAYEWYRNRGAGASGTSPFSTGSATDQTPTSGSLDSSGGLSGTPDDTSSVLSALAGENQALLDSVLAGQQGLVSLAGSSLGSPSATTGSSTVASSTPAVRGSAAAPLTASQTAARSQLAATAPLAGDSGQSNALKTSSGSGALSVGSDVASGAAQDAANQGAIDIGNDAITGALGAPSPPQNLNPQGSAGAATVSGARPGGTSSNQTQGVYSIH